MKFVDFVIHRRKKRVLNPKVTMGKKTGKQNPEKEVEAVDDVHAKIGKQFSSRCSPTYFSNVMSELKPILGEQQRMRISDSPFCKWIDMPVIAISSGRLDYFLNRFDVPSCSFLINDDVMIPFRSSDFSIVLGLHHSGQPVDLDLKMESRFLARHFASKVTKADRAAIRERMMLLAGSIGVREYPNLGVRRSLNLYPRLFRWGKSKIPLKSAEADTLLNLVDITQVLPIRPFNEEENLVSEDGMPEVRRLEKILIRQSENINLLEKRCGELEDKNIIHELNVAEAVVEKGEKSGEGAELDEASKDENEANKDVEGSELSLSKLNEITVFQSSIVDNVRTRADHVKKRKGSMFVTPPSSTPRQKTRVKKQMLCCTTEYLCSMGQTFVDVDEVINMLGEREMDEFRGGADFIGHEKSSDEDRKLVMEFLGKDKLDVIVWEDEHMSLSGHALCTLLFHEPVESEIINVYMRIMRQQSLLNGSEIFCMDTNVQREILEHLEKFGKRRKIQNSEYEAFASRLSSFTRSKLMELNEEIFSRCREEGIFKLWNSKHDTFAVGTAKVYALVYESIPTLGVRRSLNLYPRLFRWGKSKIPLKSAEADTLLNLVDITQVLPIRPFNEEENLVSEDGMPEGEKSGEGAELDEASKDGNEANKDVEGSELSLSKLNEITVFQSSIVDNVRTRADRVKKRKGSMFVTPPSSTPRQKKRVKKQAFVDVDEAINSLGEREMDEFRGRADFIGHEKSSDEDRKLVMEFLGKDKLDVIVWEDEHMSLSGHALCTLLFHEPVESEIINVYMRIMRQQSLLNGSEIFCMDTNVQREILEHLENLEKEERYRTPTMKLLHQD
ncbi:hypothetical protein F511_29559 [Dorcoceras hygrometricum]|uniref:Uncharacterized protein n=1 Tax=Dorcoceras hygrometricum TaxID=472368 RepID=A0A2Z7D9I3_9LAMI|nr:hypothetical protein F511_29559 [Dorcoceras hygrometricum]